MANLIIVQVVVALTGVLLYHVLFRKKAGPSLPPGPKPLPVIGNYRDLPPAGQVEYHHWLKIKETYGPLTSVTVLGQPMIQIHDRQAAEDLLEKGSLKTSNRPTQPFANDICGFARMMPTLQYNAKLRRQRKFVHQQLGTKALAARYGHIHDVESRRFLLRVLDDPEGLRKHIKTEASAIILKIVYGYSVEPHDRDDLVESVESMMEAMGLSFVPLSWIVDIFPLLRYLPDGIPGVSFQKVGRQYRKFTDVVIDAPYALVRKQMADGTQRPSMVSALVQQYLQPGKNGTLSQEDEEAIKQGAAIMYGGGADTSVSSISTFILAMLRYPHIQQKGQKEIDEVIGYGKLPTLQDRSRLPYVEAIAKESYRYIPVIPIGTTHVTSEEIIYAGYRIPKGSYLMPMIWSFLHDPQVYPDPEEFNPERFLSPRNEPDPTEAFGFGRRVCPGKHLADDHVFLTLARLLAVFNINRLRDDQGKEIEFEVENTPGILCRPGNFPYDIKPKTAEHAALIRSVEADHPWEKGDASLLDLSLLEKE